LPYSIVVVTWQCADALGLLVDSMNRWLVSIPELVVVDNASDDDPEREARRWRGEVRFHRNDENQGFGAATNTGIALTGRDAVVLLNPDTTLLDDGLAELAAEAVRLGGLAGPRLLDADGSVQPSASGPPAGFWPWAAALWPGAVAPSSVQARIAPWRLESRTRVTWLTAACLAAPRDVLVALGPFDPAIHLYAEDIDLGLRAERAGIPCWFCPEVCRVVHSGNVSSGRRFPDAGLRIGARNRRAVLRRAYGPRRERGARLAGLVNLSVRVAAKRALRRDAAWEAACLRALRDSERVPDLPPFREADPGARASGVVRS
jgi:N-acetylglucosaminyl-diphospho-decaprenol L-rhamnosyltransferase